MKEPNKQVVRKRRHLSAEEKYQIFLESAIAKGRGNGEIGEAEKERLKATVLEQAAELALLKR